MPPRYGFSNSHVNFLSGSRLTGSPTAIPSNIGVICRRDPGRDDDRSHAGRPRPGGRRAHVRARRVGPARRLGRRGHQGRARRAGRRHAGPGLERHRRPRRRRPRPARALQPGQAEHRPRPHLRRRPRHPRQAGGDLRRVPHQQAAVGPHQAERSTSTTSAPTTRTSSTCGAPVRASGGPTPTRAPTTRWPSGTGPASPWVRSRPTTSSCRPPPAPAFGDSIGAMTIAGGIMGALFHRERTGEATTVDVSLLGHRPVVDGRRPWRSRCSSTCRGARRRGAAAPAATRWSPTTAPRTTATSPSAACRPGSTGPRPCEPHRSAGAGRRRALRRCRHDPRQRRRGLRAPGRRLRRAHRSPSGASSWPTSAGSGRSCRTPSRPRPTRNRSRTAT